MKLLRPDHQVVAFLDNDPDKLGSSFEGYPVLGPPELSELAFDRVYLASATWNATMYLQLCSEIEIPYEKIRILDEALLPGPSSISAWLVIAVGLLALGIIALGFALWVGFSLP
ncbi:MAG: hypothetical protein VCA36_02910 [Opitutales bacterium]